MVADQDEDYLIKNEDHEMLSKKTINLIFIKT
jgi:hypothetical protein